MPIVDTISQPLRLREREQELREDTEKRYLMAWPTAENQNRQLWWWDTSSRKQDGGRKSCLAKSRSQD